MASDATTNAAVDDWSGDAAPDAFTTDEERAIVDAGLASLAQTGPALPEAARRRIDALLTRLRGG